MVVVMSVAEELCQWHLNSTTGIVTATTYPNSGSVPGIHLKRTNLTGLPRVTIQLKSFEASASGILIPVF